MNALGNHILVEFMGCDPAIMNDVSVIEQNMVEAAQKAGATVINSTFHHFSPYGVSGVVVIQESHLAIHTWPEYGYAAVDLFTCGDQVDSWVSFDFLKDCFQAKNYSAIEMNRGSLNLLDRLDFDIENLRTQASKRANPEKYTRDVWFTDKDANQANSLRYTGEILYDVQSEYQRVKVLETYKYGKMLTLDNMVMTTEKDEFHYHEMIAHPACFIHGNVKNVLVIGGGDGGSVRELLRHNSIDKVTMVEIDAHVISACKTHLPNIAAAFDHPKLDLIVGDGIDFVKEADAESYDLVVVDGSDPIGPAEGLFSVEFYTNCSRILKSDGILVAQGESPKFNKSAFVDLNKTLDQIFKQTAVSLFYVPTYPTGMWSFQWGMKSEIDIKSINKDAVGSFVEEQDLRYYNEDIHTASFATPNFVKSMLK